MKKWPLPNFYFVGNYKCLDFINTLAVAGGQLVDLLQDFDDLVAWLVQAELLEETNAAQAIARWRGSREADQALAQAREFRELLHKAVNVLMRSRTVPQAAIAAVNTLLQYQTGHTELARVKGGYEKRYHRHVSELVHLLVPVAESTADLLCYGDLSLVRKCENPACVLYFYDTTKNHTRRWCSMSACGNRAKAAAHYERKRFKGIEKNRPR